MIRHSSSLLVSLIFHLLLALAIFLGYEAILLVKNRSIEEKRVKIKLCCLPQIKPVISTPKETKKVVKNTKPQTKQIIEQKPIIKPKPKKTVPLKYKPKKEPIKQIEEKPLVKEEKLQNQNKQEVVKKQLVPKDNKQEKELSPEQNYIDQNILKISELLKNNLYYPRSARKRGITGNVMVRFKLSTSAQAHSITVISSNSKILSRAAIKTIEDLSGRFPRPNEELTLDVPINYRLSR